MKKPSRVKYFLLFLFFCCHLNFQTVQAQEFNKSLATAICSDHIVPLSTPEDTGYEIYPCGRFLFPGGFAAMVPREPLSPYIDFYYVVIQSAEVHLLFKSLRTRR